MGEVFYAKGPGNEGYIKNMEVLAFHDVDGISIFQMALYRHKDRYYLYCAGRRSAECPIFDVTDPAHPELVSILTTVEGAPYQKVLKIQAAEGLLITALSSGAGAANAAGTVAQDQAGYGKGRNGINIYDISEDPVHPKLLGTWDTGIMGSNGVHRFMYNGGRYVHLASDCKGFDNMIYRILDIKNPAAPVEVGRWWMPEQFADGYGREYDPQAPHSPDIMAKSWLHGPPFVRDGYAYCGYSGAGLVILDVHDVTQPKLVGRLPLQPTFSSYFAGAKTHTALPLPGRDLVVVTNEGERFPWFNKEKLKGMPQALNNLHMVDVSDPANPTLIAEFPYPEVPENFPFPNFNDMGLGCQGPFGPHNIHEPMDHKPYLEQRGDRVYCCYFHAGMRVYDVSDPYYIKEIGYFIPPNPTEHVFKTNVGPCIATTEDCVVDDRGNIFMDTYQDGIYVLRMKEPEKD